MSDPASVEAHIAAAEPAEARPLEGLLGRLRAAGLLRGARRDDLPIGVGGLSDVLVRGVVEDSRAVGDRSLFVAVPGFHVDGHDYVAGAAAAGAGAALVEHAVTGTPLPQAIVSSSRTALAHAAGWWYGDPSRSLGVVGITGTDGKTTTSFLAVAALEAAGCSTGLIGTVETKVGDARERHEAHVTTPGAPELQATLAAMAAAGNVAAVVETTSHALELERVLGIAYDAAIFTNLTHEHLDLHGSFEAYRAAKLRLFAMLEAGEANPPTAVAGHPWPKLAVVNRDDPAAPWFEAAARAAGATVLTYGTGAADVHALAVEEDARRLRVRYAAPSGEAALELRLAGRFNVLNALAVVALGEGLGLDAGAVRAGLEGVTGVPGRMERIEQGQPFGVIVDYAHSPASLQGVLELLAPVAAARGGGLIAVFGSAGERDTAKRAQMGRTAGERCRLVVATDEDPRGEDRHAIIEEIVRGAEAAGRRRDLDVLAIADRREAIAAAFERARPGDLVLLAGKGHEPTILYADHALPWDEAAVARETLSAMGFREPG
ncbi:MAG TPA: UDP-N-acetylmuramoyl-L-alanyl-D-glutamate--2,6-diaminopimelate ligase [Candidatus Limnocylindrales bacterium]|nr:UDP-N-acetylmuramoyl-L-alanyl-D-glutamate--2,6-diaminopimelate ligase [Candidatus Limnocylindrales bacterium]